MKIGKATWSTATSTAVLRQTSLQKINQFFQFPFLVGLGAASQLRPAQARIPGAKRRGETWLTISGHAQMVRQSQKPTYDIWWYDFLSTGHLARTRATTSQAPWDLCLTCDDWGPDENQFLCARRILKRPSQNGVKCPWWTDHYAIPGVHKIWYVEGSRIVKERIVKMFAGSSRLMRMQPLWRVLCSCWRRAENLNRSESLKQQSPDGATVRPWQFESQFRILRLKTQVPSSRKSFSNWKKRCGARCESQRKSDTSKKTAALGASWRISPLHGSLFCWVGLF